MQLQTVQTLSVTQETTRNHQITERQAETGYDHQEITDGTENQRNGPKTKARGNQDDEKAEERNVYKEEERPPSSTQNYAPATQLRRISRRTSQQKIIISVLFLLRKTKVEPVGEEDLPEYHPKTHCRTDGG